MRANEFIKEEERLDSNEGENKLSLIEIKKILERIKSKSGSKD